MSMPFGVLVTGGRFNETTAGYVNRIQEAGTMLLFQNLVLHAVLNQASAGETWCACWGPVGKRVGVV